MWSLSHFIDFSHSWIGIVFNFAIIDFWISKIFLCQSPFSSIFNLGNTKRSQGLGSGECAEWLRTGSLPPTPFKNCCTIVGVYDGALWGKLKQQCFHTSGFTRASFSEQPKTSYVKFFNDPLAFWNKFFVHHSFTIEKQDKPCFDFQFLEAKFFCTLWFWSFLSRICPLC